MTGSEDVRWQQRFNNYEKALSLLSEAAARNPALTLLEKEGVIRRFEYCFELAWKTIKDFLEAEGAIISPATPRQILKDAFAAKVIVDGQTWIAMLDHRNLLSHTYDSIVFEEAATAISNRYVPAMQALRQYLALRKTP